MNTFFVAQAVAGSFVSWAILIVGVAAIIALVVLGLRKMGVAIPDFVVQAFWIVVIAVVVIAAIIFLARFAGLG